MIIWRGFGFLIVVIVFGFALGCNFAFDAFFGKGYYETHKWTIGVAMLLSAAVCWILGTALRKRPAQIVIDKLTGREMAISRNRHCLFFIPMHLWAPILTFIACVLFVLEFVGR
jgi:hypothetical protein